MSASKVASILVVGGGTMGRGIAQVCLESSWSVKLVETDPGTRDELAEAIEGGLSRRDHGQAIKRLEVLDSLPDDSVWGAIEAVPERPELKQDILADLEPLARNVLASNTSSIPIHELAESLDEPNRLVGVHFMNPVPVMDIVELVFQDDTPEEVRQDTRDLLQTLDKEPLEVEDVPGFVSNRLLLAFINRAVRLVEDGVADPETVDTMMTEGMGHAMGPLEVADFIGLDVCREILVIIYERTEDPAYRPAETFNELIEAGHLGQKTGQGFFNYLEPDS